MKAGKILSLVLCIAMLITSFIVAIPASAEESALPFTDVRGGDNPQWFYNYVKKMYDMKLMNGISETEFSPNGKLTRAMFVTILGRLACAVTVESNTFPDVPSGKYYSGYVGWAVEQGIVKGYEDGTFRPDRLVNRGELAVMFHRYMEKHTITIASNPTVDSFKDKDSIQSWAVDAVDVMRQSNIICGDPNGYFNPTNNATRAECAKMFSALLDGAPDEEMRYKFVNILDLIPVKNRRIELTFGLNFLFTKEAFSDKLLTALQLDPDTFEFVFDDSEFAKVRSGYSGIDYGAKHIARLNVSIKNKVTGIATDSKSLTFVLTKVKEFYYVDPDGLDLGIDDELYAQMMEKSLYYEGNLDRIATFFNKLENGEEVTAGFIGGSITAGAGATSTLHTWNQLSCNWLQEQYSGSRVNCVNAGIGGTPSSYGIMRLERDVMVHNPDIVFIEFAVNDHEPSHTDIQNVFESLVRTVLMDESAPAVVIVLSFCKDNDDLSFPFMKDVGKFYGVPVIDVHSAVSLGLENEAFDFETYVPDEVHPSDYGQHIICDTLEHYYRTTAEMVKAASAEDLEFKPLREDTITGANYTEVEFVSPEDLEIDSIGSWEITNMNYDSYTSAFHNIIGDDTSPLVFTLNCKSLMMLSKGNSGSPANYSISVNGGEPIIISGSTNVDTPQILIKGDEVKEYTITVTPLGDRGAYLTLLGFAYN